LPWLNISVSVAVTRTTPQRVTDRKTLDTQENVTMALGIYFALSGMTADKYNECIKRLKQAGAAHPVGRSYHSSFGTPDKLSVFDVWSSQAAFEKFGKTLMPILHDLGIDPGQPSVMPIHNIIRPPSARPKKAKPAKRAGAKRRSSKR
jgi:hypothetical protein